MGSSSSGAAPRSRTGSSPVNNLSSSSETLFSDLQALRKKYDAVVEYTVHLTAERDTILNQLEDLKSESLKGKKKGFMGRGDERSEKKIQQVPLPFFLIHPYKNDV